MLDVLASLGGKVADRLLGVQDRRQSQDFAMQQQAANLAAQREFAQMGIRWKVDDAKAAGIHPLYALGAQTHSFSPIAVSSGDNPATSFGSMGQDISRAVNAGRTADERQSAVSETLQKLSVERASLENDILRQKLRSNIAAAQPAIPSVVPEANNFEERPQLMAGEKWPTNPHWVNAEDVEKRYGDLVQELYGAGVLAADTWHNWNNWSRARDTRANDDRRYRKLSRYRDYLSGRDSFDQRFYGR